MLSPRRAALREATAGQHRRVDALIEDANTFGDLSSYGDHLLRMHLFHRRFDKQLNTADYSIPARWRVADRVQWLVDDLASLVLTPLLMSDAGLVHEPTLGSLGHRLGALYVLIGSELGAAFLVKRLGSLGLTSDSGGRYLSGLASSRAWPDFLLELESARLDSEADLLAGATETFDFLIGHLGEFQG